MQPEFTSDPPLGTLDILTLLFSDQAPSGDIELAGLQRPNEREQRLVEARATRALTGALSQEVGRVVEQTFGVDTFQITPLLVDPYQQSAGLAVNPAARVTIGKRLSDRIYLTYARSLSSSTRDEIILLEYDQSDTLGWVLSQNEDGTYALEVRRGSHLMRLCSSRPALAVVPCSSAARSRSEGADGAGVSRQDGHDVEVEIAGVAVAEPGCSS